MALSAYDLASTGVESSSARLKLSFENRFRTGVRDLGLKSRLRTKDQYWTTVLCRSALARLVMLSHAKERKSIIGRSSLTDSGIMPISGVPPDMDFRE